MAPKSSVAGALALFLLCFNLLHHAAHGKGYATTGLTSAQQCHLDRIQASQPTHRIESEGGTTEIWDQKEDQFQCAGVAVIRTTIRPDSLFLPEFMNAPRLAFIERGRGILGITYPGCPETYHSEGQAGSKGRREEAGESGRGQDLHQKVQRIRRGDLVAIPEGAVHWCHNDGDEELVAITVVDLNNQANQLDQRLRAFFLAGGQGRSESGNKWGEGGDSRINFHNIFAAFDDDMLAEAYDVPTEIIRNLKRDDGRGFIVNPQKRIKVMVPEEQEKETHFEEQRRGRSSRSRRFSPSWSREGADNGLDETFCTMKMRHNMETRRESDVFSRQAGRLNLVNLNKLPILGWIDMSAERGNLLPNALYSPHWSMTDHRVMYVTGGDAHVQISGSKGQNVFDERVSQGSVFVIPQFFVTVARAGNNGFEWVSFKTSSQPMQSPLAGYTSVFRALPLQIITNAYQISSREAEELKYNREHQTFLLSPSRKSIRMPVV